SGRPPVPMWRTRPARAGPVRGPVSAGPPPPPPSRAPERGYTARMQTDEALRNLLVSFLEGEAHLSLADALKGFPVKDINVKPRNVPYTFWHLLEHIRIAQWDIVDFVK